MSSIFNKINFLLFSNTSKLFKNSSRNHLLFDIKKLVEFNQNYTVSIIHQFFVSIGYTANKIYIKKVTLWSVSMGIYLKILCKITPQ